jgi:hypothetical protein
MIVSPRRDLLHPHSTVPYKLPVQTVSTAAVDPLPGNCAAVVDFGGSKAPLLALGTLGGVGLTQDGMPVSISRSEPLPFTFTLRGDDPYDVVSIRLAEVIAVANATQLRMIRMIHTTDGVFELDPVELLANRRYIIGVSTQRRYPMAATGDFVTQTLPIATSSMFTPMFQIVN